MYVVVFKNNTETIPNLKYYLNVKNFLLDM